MTLLRALALTLPLPFVQEIPTRFLERTLAAYEALDAGELERARELFTAILERFPEHANSAYALACVAARTGDTGTALDWLEKAVSHGYSDFAVAEWDPDLASVRSNARFDALRARMAARPDGSLRGAELEWTAPNHLPQFSNDGTRVVMGTGVRGSLLDTSTNELVAVLGPANVRPRGAGFGPLGHRIAFTMLDEALSVWDGFAGSLVWNADALGSCASLPDWARDGSSLLLRSSTLGSACVRIDAETGAKRAEYGVADLGAWENRDGSRVLTVFRSGERSAVGVMHDASSAKELFRFELEGMPGVSGGFSPSGRFVWWCLWDPGVVQIADPNNGRVLRSLVPSEGAFTSAYGLPDRDVVVTTGGGRGLAWWDLATGELLRSAPFEERNEYGTVLASDDGRYLLTARWGMAIIVWDARSGEELSRLDATRHARWISGAAFSGDGERLVLPFDDRLTVYETRTGKELGKLGAPSLAVGAPALSPDGSRMIVPCEDGALRVVELASSRKLATWRPRAGRLDTVRFDAAGTSVIVDWRDGSFATLDASTGAVRRLVERALDVDWTELVTSDDGTRAVARAADGHAVLFDLQDGRELAKLGPAGWGEIFAFDSSGGRLAAPNGAGGVVLYDSRTGERLPREFAVGDDVRSLAFSPDGSRLACGTDHAGLFVWGIVDGALVRQHETRDAFVDEALGVRGVRFDPSGDSVVFTTGDFATVRRLVLGTGVETMLYDTSCGSPATVLARPSVSGKRLYVHGGVAGDKPVLDAANGRALVDLRLESLGFVDGTRDDRWVVGTIEHAVRVFGERLDARYSYIPFEDGGWIVKSESLHCAGTAAALRWAVIVIGEETYPFASFASELLDPKRVRAAAAGVRVRPAKLGTPPKARVVGDAIRTIDAGADSVRAEFEFSDPRGIAGAELDFDGEALDGVGELFAAFGKAQEPLTIAFQRSRRARAQDSELRLVLYNRAGVGSRPVRVRFVTAK